VKDAPFYLSLCHNNLSLLIKKRKNIILNYIKIEGDNKEDLPNVGKLIGLAERTITLTLVLLGQFEAIGFLIAAKSILRYGEKTQQTEYVLIGTLLSFGIAIISTQRFGASRYFLLVKKI